MPVDEEQFREIAKKFDFLIFVANTRNEGPIEVLKKMTKMFTPTQRKMMYQHRDEITMILFDWRGTLPFFPPGSPLNHIIPPKRPRDPYKEIVIPQSQKEESEKYSIPDRLLTLYEDETHIYAMFDVPDVEREDFIVKREGNVLSVSTREGAARSYHEKVKFGYAGKETVEAKYEKGILALTFEKKIENPSEKEEEKG